MTILQLKYVLAIAGSSSMREAASKLFVSQPALSATIHELEEELGIKIFERNNKNHTVCRDFLRIMPIQSFDHVEHFGYCSPLSIMKSVPARLSCHLRYRNPARLQMSSPFRRGAEIHIRQASSPN